MYHEELAEKFVKGNLKFEKLLQANFLPSEYVDEVE